MEHKAVANPWKQEHLENESCLLKLEFQRGSGRKAEEAAGRETRQILKPESCYKSHILNFLLRAKGGTEVVSQDRNQMRFS